MPQRGCSKNTAEVIRLHHQQYLSRSSDDRAGQRQISFAEPLDERCKDHNNDDLRDVFCEVEHAVKLVVTEYILRIISGNRAVERLVDSQRERGAHHDQKILVLAESLDAL